MSLASIEAEILHHAQGERRRWQEVASLLMRVERESLWQGHAPSFTAWLQGMARRADLQESVFWRCLKAGRIYTELTGQEELDARHDVSAESLELADKISRVAPKAVTTQMLTRTLEGELSRSELRQLWETYRPAAGGATARGRLPTDEDARNEAVAARRAAWEAEKKKPQNRAEVQRGELIAAFRSASWLNDFDQARAETHVHDLGERVAAFLIVRRKPHDTQRVELHGLWTCTSRPELVDFTFNAPPGADFMWLALPSDLRDAALEKTPRLLGLLELTRERTLRVVREAQRRNLTADGRLALLSALLQRAYLWP